MQERRNEHIEELVFDYLMGELAEDQKQELLAWLQADKENKKLFSEMTDRWAIAHVPLFDLNKKSDFKKNFDFFKCFRLYTIEETESPEFLDKRCCRNFAGINHR